MISFFIQWLFSKENKYKKFESMNISKSFTRFIETNELTINTNLLD
jgi:hypothetical protein